MRCDAFDSAKRFTKNNTPINTMVAARNGIADVVVAANTYPF